MHIMLVTTSYPESHSGSEAAGGFVQEFASQLAHHARVTIVAATGGISSIATEGPLKVRRFAVLRWPLSLLNSLDPRDWWPIWATLRDGLLAVREVVKSDRPDYIFALWALPSGYWARQMSKSFGIPYGIWSLGSDIWSLGRIPILRSYLRKVLVDAERCYADGILLCRDVERICGAQCEFLPSARRLPVRELTDPASEPPYRLGFLGRWHHNKGVDLLLDALLKLDNEDWDLIEAVRICGGGPLEASIRSAVSALKVRGRPIEAEGYLDMAAATVMIRWSDYLILPSRIESIPVIFSDAVQLRRPLIATPVGDLPDLHRQHEFGILAEDATSVSIATAIHEGLQFSACQFRSGLDALARQFDVAVIAAQFARHVRERVAR